VATRTANPSVVDVSGTEFYACGTIGIAARITYGKRGRTGVARLTGTGTLTGGTGNYRDVTGTFALTGKYSARTKRGTLVLRGTATFGERPPLYDLR
jgi:hypothetical protein